MASKTKVIKQHRSAVTGKFVTKGYAEKHKRITVAEARKIKKGK